MPRYRKTQRRKLYPSSEDMENKKDFPRIHFDLETLPEAHSWEIGEEYEIALKVRQTGLNLTEDDDRHQYADFEILGVAILKNDKNKKRPRY